MAVAEVTSPFRGLSPYTDADAPFFFGRDHLTSVLCDNLLGTTLTLVYGPSGVGKSSVLSAGVAWRLGKRARANLERRGEPEFAVVVHRTWRDDPVAALCRAVERAAGELARVPVHAGGDGDLAETVDRCAAALGGDLLIVLDQLEEYFTYHPADERFATQLGRAASLPGAPASFLLSIREDALGRLDALRPHLPTLFDNAVRIAPLDRAAAREAIERPVVAFAERSADGTFSIEPPLVDAVLEQTRGSVRFSEANPIGSAGLEFDPSALQLVLTRVWEVERAAGSTVLRLGTLRELGGARQIVESFVAEAIAQLPFADREIAAQVLRFLVTPSGMKVALSAEDLASFTELPPDEVLPVLDRLSSATVRILRPVADASGRTAYEVYHDLVGSAALEWSRAWQAARRAEELHRRRGRGRLRLALLVALLIAAAFAAGLALGLRASRDRAAGELEQRAHAELDVGDAGGLGLGVADAA